MGELWTDEGTRAIRLRLVFAQLIERCELKKRKKRAKESSAYDMQVETKREREETKGKRG